MPARSRSFWTIVYVFFRASRGNSGSSGSSPVVHSRTSATSSGCIGRVSLRRCLEQAASTTAFMLLPGRAGEPGEGPLALGRQTPGGRGLGPDQPQLEAVVPLVLLRVVQHEVQPPGEPGGDHQRQREYHGRSFRLRGG